MAELIQKILQFMDDNHLLGSTAPIVLAVSGGADSVALLHIFAQMRSNGLLCNDLVVAHVNHHLRGQLADRDEAFVLNEARSLNLHAVAAHIDVTGYAAEHKLSIETAARQLRRQELIRIAATHNAAYIATAHHKNDNAETLVHRMLRGTGFRGLAGILPQKQFDGITFIRPLLAMSRDEILNYLGKNDLTFQHDHTNDEIIYTRNFIRHRLLPALQKESKSDLVELLNTLAAHSHGLSEMLTAKLDAIWAKVVVLQSSCTIKLGCDLLRQIPFPLRMEAIRRALVEIGSGQRDLTQEHYLRIADAIETNTQVTMELPDRVLVRIGKTITFSKNIPSKNLPAEPVVLPVPGTAKFNGIEITARIIPATASSLEEFLKNKSNMVERFDLDKITLPLTARLRRDGDSFWPIGMKAQKKVGQFLSDSKLPASERKTALVIADAEKIVWLAPLRPSELTKITSATKNILEIRIYPRKLPQ